MNTFRLFHIRKIKQRQTDRARIRELEMTVMELRELAHNQNKILMQIAKTIPSCQFKKIGMPMSAVYDHVNGNLEMYTFDADEPQQKEHAEFFGHSDDFDDDDLDGELD